MAIFCGPESNEDGIILCLDAGNPKSYPGSGTTWTDIAAGASGSLVNSPTYSSANGGSLVFNSSRVCTVSMDNLRPTSQITQECWFNISSNVTQVFIGSQYGTSSNNSYAIWLNAANTLAAGVNIGGTFNNQTVAYTLSTGVWYHFAHTYNGSTQVMYMNGVSVNSWGTSGAITYDTNNTLLAVGNDWNGSGYNTGASVGVVGNLAIVNIYNTALTAAQILQNYTAHRRRFGL